MGKVKKQKSKTARVSPYDDHSMMDIEKPKAAAAEVEVEDRNGEETSRAMSKRHREEWKTMKHEVALLKKKKQKLRKKFVAEREEKREVNKKIKMLIETTKKRQLDEAKALGVDNSNALEAEASEMMVDE